MARFGSPLNLFTSIAILSTFALAQSSTVQASQAYGSINNFDTVNDTGSVCHGFEIEIDDARSTDITYTYDYNHYGVPKITQDNTNPAHPKVFVLYQSAKNPDGSWAAYTAIPARFRRPPVTSLPIRASTSAGSISVSASMEHRHP